MGRSMSEPLEGDNSVVVFDQFDGPLDDDSDRVSEDLVLDDASDELARRRADTSDSRELDALRDTSDIPGDESRTSRVSFAEEAEVSFQPDDAYSSGEDDVQYGLASVQDEEADDNSDEEAEPSNAGKLDLLDPKDLTALLKRRIVKKRKSRISPITGAPLPPLPQSVLRDLFSLFLSPSSSTSSASLLSSRGGGGSGKKAKLDATVMDELDNAAHDFFADFSSNLLSQAKTRTRSGNVGTITEADVVAVLKRQGRVTQRHDASSLAHRLLPRELTDQMELWRWAKTGTVQTTLRDMFAGGSRGDRSVAEGSTEGSSDD